MGPDGPGDVRPRREIPPSPSWLQQLTDFLYLLDNQLSDLPRSLGRLSRLRFLNISDNAFDVLPEAVTGMSGLLELRVAINRLSGRPPIAGLVRLRALHLRNHQLTALPDFIGSLVELRQIDLRGNPVAELPECVLDLPRLDKVDLRWVTTLRPPSWLAELERRGCAIYL